LEAELYTQQRRTESEVTLTPKHHYSRFVVELL